MKWPLIQFARASANCRMSSLARREHHLPQLAVDHVAVDVRVGEDVVLPQGLKLRDGVVEGAPVPQPHVVEQRLCSYRIDRSLELPGMLDFLQTRVPGRKPSASPRYGS